MSTPKGTEVDEIEGEVDEEEEEEPEKEIFEDDGVETEGLEKMTPEVVESPIRKFEIIGTTKNPEVRIVFLLLSD